MSHTSTSPKPHDQLIAVAGNIGVGKSTLIEMYARARNAHAAYEPYGDNPFLSDFYQDMPRWGFATQVHFLTQRVRQIVALSEKPGLILQDRSLYEDGDVFARNLYNQAHLSEREWRTYRELYTCLTRSLRRPNLVVYLRASLPTLQKRIAERGRDFEREIPASYLQGLNSLYEQWAQTFQQAPLLILDADRLDFVAKPEAFQEVCSVLDQAIGREPEQG